MASASGEQGERPIVAFLGPPSSFTHQATKSAFPEQTHTYHPVVTIKDVFDAVQSGAASLGVVPFENSTHGVVTFTLDSLADRQGAFADLNVCGEVYLDVNHFLMGYKQKRADGAGAVAHLSSSPSTSSPPHQKDEMGTSTPTQANPTPLPPRAAPLHPLGHIKRVLSHPQALGQTNAFLSTYLRGVDCVDVSSTSKAAEMASWDSTGETAAVAGCLAADMFGLDVLARFIQDRDDNTTRFFVLRRRGREDQSGDEDGTNSASTTIEATISAIMEQKSAPGEKGYKSLVSFTVPHSSPGALASVLDVFKRHRLNLTSINSLPSLVQPFHYIFFVEFEGSRYHDVEGKVQSALNEINDVAQGWRWLGSWARHR
ncbi:chorismate mutase prephenate dehydratase [Coniella lustricola]|uniref:prephenate dehydratase n=1 Tax=Coniella lustricola TaxID=2025994 RepID=A0A2T3AFQ2_9PEZI|nr:chorismate mutase prephenate dehydratase [Coniella lustricola]